MRHSRASLALAVVLIPAILGACTKREDLPLAEFKDRSITIGEFERSYARVDPVFLPKSTGFEGKQEFLTTMLNKEVMAYKADELGYDKDPSVVQGMEAYRRMGLQAGYMKRKVVDRVTVTEEQIKEHYRNRGAVCYVRQILLDTPEEADHVYALLQDGADFESVCKEYSKGADAAEGGKVVTVNYGKFAPDFQRRVFTLPVGGYTEPFYSPYGFFIIKVVRRQDDNKKAPYDEIYDTLEQEVRVQNEMMMTNEITDEIRERNGVEWYWDGLRIAFEALPPDRPLNNPPSRNDEVYPLLYFEPEDLDKPIVTYKDKTIAIKDFSDYYDQASFFNRPRRDFRLGGIRQFLTERIMAELVVDEMVASNIAEDPEVAAAIRAKEEELMINKLYDDMVSRQTTVNAKMIQSYYQDNMEDFKVPEKRRFGVVLCGDLETAQAAYKEITNGELFRNVAMAYSIDEATKRTLGETEQLAKGEQPELDRVGFALPRVGAVSEPFETSRGWMVLKLTERVPERTFSLEEARGQIESALKQIENEKRLDELLDKWKEEVGVVIHEDNLRKVQIEERSPGSAPKKAV